MARTAEILVDVCAYAGTGNVLKVQQMLQICAEHAAKPKKTTETAAPAAATQAAEGDASGEAAPAPDAQGDVNMDTSDSAPAAQVPAPTTTAGSTGAAAAATESLSDLVASQANNAPADEEEADDAPILPLKHQAVACIGIALIAMGEDVGAEMALRQFQHLVSYTFRW